MQYILVVSENRLLLESLAGAFDDKEAQLDLAISFSAAIELSSNRQYDAALFDTPRFDSAASKFLAKFIEQNPQTVIIPIAPDATVKHVTDAMRNGAADFIHEPTGPSEILARIENCIEKRRMKNEIDFLRRTQPVIYKFDDIVGESAAMKKVFSIMRRVAPTDATVLITGETGTGKELIAGALHFNSSRSKNSFVKVNCAALPDNLLESELFGHEKGAFTGAHRQRVGRFEQANTGSIFLDEIGDMGMSTQAKILRVLQEHQFERLGGTQTINVDVRVIAATNKDLTELMASGEFREDLFYRLNVVTIELAPLRQRSADIAPLVDYFLKKYMRQISNQVTSVAPSVIGMLREYDWPGNIRQLQNVIERAVIMCDGTKIQPEHIALYEKRPPGGTGAFEIPEEGIKLEEVERMLIVQALERTGWVQKNAAKLLGISPRVINYKIRKHNIKGGKE